MLMKNSNIIGNRTRDLPVCSAVPQPPRAPHDMSYTKVNIASSSGSLVSANTLKAIKNFFHGHHFVT
jgi:hypothetical protein